MPRTWDGVVSQHINRKFSRPLAQFLASHTKASPNQVTMLSFVIAFFSGLIFYSSQPILGGILAQLSSILDGVDGDLAFLTNKMSVFGGFLDSVLDRYGDILILGGMLYYTFAAEEPCALNILVGTAAVIGSLMVSYSRTRAQSDLDLIFKEGFSGYAANRDVRLFIIMLGGILNQVFITLIVLAVLTNLTVLTRIYIARKKVSNK